MSDDRKVLFLSFAETLKMLTENRAKILTLPDNKIYYPELASGIYYLDYGENLIFKPAKFNYEGYFNVRAHSTLIVYLKSFKESLPQMKAQLLLFAKTEEEKILSQEFTGRVLYREPGTDRQLKHLNSLLRSNGVTPINSGEANAFWQGISVLRKRCVFKEIIE